VAFRLYPEPPHGPIPPLPQPKVDRDTEIAVVVLRALAQSVPSPALRERLGAAIGAGLLEAFRTPDAPDSRTDRDVARRHIVVAVRKGVLATLNPVVPSRGRPAGQLIAARSPPC
jgi:hypothetical protein